MIPNHIEEESDSALGSIGFMFDAEAEKESRTIHFSLPEGCSQATANGNGAIRVELKTLGDQPGHVQSGHYLWPAAQALANHVISNWSFQADSATSQSSGAPTNRLPVCEEVLELGAGCGLSGLTVAQLPPVQQLILTDYDPGSLKLLEENIQLNRARLPGESSAHYLKWGQTIPDEVSTPRASGSELSNRFRLILGADLIYSIDVIRPLFTTVGALLAASQSVFVLASSFALNEQYELEIDAACEYCHLRRILVKPLEESSHLCKIEYYQHLASAAH